MPGYAGAACPRRMPAAYARAVLAELQDTGFAGTVTDVDIQMIGTLADPTQSRADLALIALPHEQIADALEFAGRIHCRPAATRQISRASF